MSLVFLILYENSYHKYKQCSVMCSLCDAFLHGVFNSHNICKKNSYFPYTDPNQNGQSYAFTGGILTLHPNRTHFLPQCEVKTCGCNLVHVVPWDQGPPQLVIVSLLPQVLSWHMEFWRGMCTLNSSFKKMSCFPKMTYLFHPEKTHLQSFQCKENIYF